MSLRKKPRDERGRFISKRTSNATPRIAASVAVLGTPELLEAILLELPMQTMLLSQRTCKTWQDMVITSPKIQRALFFAPATCGDVCYMDWRLDDKGFYGGGRTALQLGEHLRGPGRDQIPVPYKAHWGLTRSDAGKFRVFYNPLLAKLFPFISGKGIFTRGIASELPECALHDNASWQRMYFTQPAVNFLAVEWDSQDGHSTSPDWTVTSIQMGPDGGGMKMERLLGQLMTYIREPAWIQGVDEWEEWTGPQDLRRTLAKAV